MLTPSSATTSPSLNPQDVTNSRKRQRSLSSESLSSSSSAKRSMSADPNVDIHETPRPKDISSLSIADSSRDADIDAYMTEQGEASDEPTIKLDSIAPRITLNEEVPPTLDVAQLTPAQKFERIKAICAKKMTAGQTWYLVSKRWHRRWERACTGVVDKEGVTDEKDIGPVDNSPIVDIQGNIVSSISEGVDVEYVPEEAWNLLVSWYGPPVWTLARKVITRGLAHEPTIELHPPRLYTHRLIDALARIESLQPGQSTRVITLSCKDTVTTLRRAIVEAHYPNRHLLPDQYRIWKLDDSHEHGEQPMTASYLQNTGAVLVEDIDKALDDALIENGDSFAIETKRQGAWIVNADLVGQKPASEIKLHTPESAEGVPVSGPLFGQGTDFFSNLQLHINPTSTVVPSQSSLKPALPIKPTFTKDPRPLKVTKLTPGTLGLGNMGNTCFMNSAIQCLAHTKELADYFLSGVYEKELNTDNPLGMGGAIAEAFGQLLRRIWEPTTSNSSYSPREFKQVLQKFAPQFSGYQQHDSQELVAFLLDGLHEDLNRVLKKPYVEKPDWEGGGDKELVELAQTSWQGYMKRNDSVIVDLFQGQYQSTLVCPECQKVSITFDPFMYLTLPLPVQKKWRHDIHYIPWDLNKPHMKIPVEINSNSSFKDLRVLLGRWMNTDPDHLRTMEVFNNRIYKDLNDNIPCGDMADTDVIACYELPCHSQQSRTYKAQEGDPFIVPIHLFETTTTRQRGNNATGFGFPLLALVSQEAAKNVDAMYDIAVDRIQRWTTNVRDLHQWEAGSSSTPMEEVPIHLSGSQKTETVTEIKENGDVVTVQESLPEEGDIVDEKCIVVQEQDNESTDSQDGLPRRVGFKKDLFTFRFQPTSLQYNSDNGLYHYVGIRLESWDQRIEKFKNEEIEFILREGDAFACEFDENVKSYFFGGGPGDDHATFRTWKEFVHPEYTASREAVSKQKNRGITLQDCLDEFTKEEQLGEDDLWYCPRCKKHQQAIKRFDLWSVPDMLVVHLKRFSNNRSLRDKIDTLVEFPLTDLDLTTMVGERQVARRLVENGEDPAALGLNNVDEPLIYDLYAVDEHMGGLGGGHYRAYAHNDVDDKWYHFDDSYVSTADSSSSVTSNAYLLFYKRRSSRPLGGKSHEKVVAAQKMAESTPSENLDTDMDIDESQPESHVPTPPVGTPDSRSDQPTWRTHNADNWTASNTNTHSSPASSPPPLDDPPAFDDALNDPILMENLEPLALFDGSFRGEQVNFSPSDNASRGSPSSVRAEFDQDRDSDLDLDLDADDESDPDSNEIPKSLASMFPATITMGDADQAHSSSSVDKDVQDNLD